MVGTRRTRARTKSTAATKEADEADQLKTATKSDVISKMESKGVTSAGTAQPTQTTPVVTRASRSTKKQATKTTVNESKVVAKKAPITKKRTLS